MSVTAGHHVQCICWDLLDSGANRLMGAAARLTSWLIVPGPQMTVKAGGWEPLGGGWGVLTRSVMLPPCLVSG